MLRRVFERYADETLRLEARGVDVLDPGGRRLARVDRIVLARNRIAIEGWTEAARLTFALNRMRQSVTPTLVQPGRADRGFRIDMPFAPGPLLIEAEIGGQVTGASLPGFGAAGVAWARRRLWLRYLGIVAGLLPQIWGWKVRGDTAARAVIRHRLKLVPASDAVVMDGAAVLPGRAGPAGHPFAAVSIVMPVHDAFDLLCQALDCVRRHSDGSWRLILIEDASRDARVLPFLERFAKDPALMGRVRLIRNTANLGFVGSANLGLAAAREWPEDPVILLNSDAMVPPGWIARLVAPLAAADVASVTPMSNDAEIFNVPVICRPGPLPAGLADRIDAAARALPDAPAVEVPTGVGFCMAMAPAFLARVPGFDPAFGRGYGEETDWCQRTRALGGRHLAAAGLFVEHRGAASFTTPDKVRLLAANGAEITRRYPGYDREVQAFIRQDPLVAPRLALGMAWAAGQAEGPVPVYLAHDMGGGAEMDLQRRIADDLAQAGAAVVLRVGSGHRWRIDLCTPLGNTSGLTGDEALVRDLIGRLPRRRIVYSCGVGDHDPVTLPDLLLDLAGRGATPLPGGTQPVEILVHDFFPVSPSYTLLWSDTGYRGVPLAAGPAAADRAHQAERADGRTVDLAEWQRAWGRLVNAADRVTVFSESSRAILTEVYPAAAPAIRVVPHRLPEAVPAIPPARAGDGRPVIGVLGNIGLHKGAPVLERLSRDLARDRRAGLVVIGLMDPAYRLAPPARIHGSYERSDLPGLVARYGISAWLIPSIWPETFSFTTHEALATGMPVVCFDLGAQAEAVRRAGGPGGILPLEVPARIDVDRLLALAGLADGDPAP